MGKTLPELDNTNKLFLTYLKIPDQKKKHTLTILIPPLFCWVVILTNWRPLYKNLTDVSGQMHPTLPCGTSVIEFLSTSHKLQLCGKRNLNF